MADVKDTVLVSWDEMEFCLSCGADQKRIHTKTVYNHMIECWRCHQCNGLQIFLLSKGDGRQDVTFVLIPAIQDILRTADQNVVDVIQFLRDHKWGKVIGLKDRKAIEKAIDELAALSTSFDSLIRQLDQGECDEKK